MNYTQVRRNKVLFAWNDALFQTKSVRAKNWRQNGLVSQQQDAYGNTRIVYGDEDDRKSIVFYHSEKFEEIEL